MKTTSQCPKCIQSGRAGDQVVYVSELDDATNEGYVPQTLTHTGWLFGGKRCGQMEAYVCNACGYVEFYIKDYPLPRSHARPKAEFEQVAASKTSTDEPCLACGATIPADADKCPACGWTWITDDSRPD